MGWKIKKQKKKWRGARIDLNIEFEAKVLVSYVVWCDRIRKSADIRLTIIHIDSLVTLFPPRTNKDICYKCESSHNIEDPNNVPYIMAMLRFDGISDQKHIVLDPKKSFGLLVWDGGKTWKGRIKKKLNFRLNEIERELILLAAHDYIKTGKNRSWFVLKDFYHYGETVPSSVHERPKSYPCLINHDNGNPADFLYLSVP